MPHFLNKLDHRPWPLPEGRWVMEQRWHDLLFSHWPIRPEILRPLIPRPLELDTWDSEAWLGVVPFRMSGIRLRGAPALPGISAFPELNVRTYVSFEGKPGVWFFSLDAASLIAVATARLWFHLPYFLAKMSLLENGGSIHYLSQRTGSGTPGIRLQAQYSPASEAFAATSGTLDHWLTERYCLYAGNTRRMYRGEIHHAPWQLQRARAEFGANTMTDSLGISLPDIAPLLHFAKFQSVVAWAPLLLTR
jgi:uncharacterized protein